MAKYLVIHNVGKDLTYELGKPFAEMVKAKHTTNAYWVKSFYIRQEGKFYCEWDAKDAASIREVITNVTPEFADDDIFEMELRVNSEDFR